MQRVARVCQRLLILVEIRERTDRQTDRRTHTLIALLCTPAAGKVSTISIEKPPVTRTPREVAVVAFGRATTPLNEFARWSLLPEPVVEPGLNC